MPTEREDRKQPAKPAEAEPAPDRDPPRAADGDRSAAERAREERDDVIIGGEPP